MFEDLIGTYGLSNVMYDMEHLYPHGYSLLSSWFSPKTKPQLAKLLGG